MTLIPKLIGGYSGTLVENFGYESFFLFASALGVPVIALIYFLQNRLEFSLKT
ncbi:MAG: PAT family beta-lactamase induction signal transducer AmpG [Arenicella sp.]|jgi:PAT family beta-lactamase induction signal transducer AmpG